MITEKITGPGVWMGKDMAAHPERWQYELTQADITALSNAAEQILSSGKPLAEVGAEAFSLGTAESAVLRWRDMIEKEHGFVLVRGVPVTEWSEEKVAAAYWAIGLHLGTPVSQNTDGDVLGHVHDTGANPADPAVRLYKTRAAQDFHVDGADLVGLLCLTPAKSGGANQIVSSYTLYNLLLEEDPALCKALYEPVAFDTQGQHAEGEQPWFMLPIAHEGAGGTLRLFYIGWYIRDAQRHAGVPKLTPMQKKAIERLEAYAHDPAVHLNMDFRPGDIQIIKNASMLHARAAYEDWDDPAKKRHLPRLWLSSTYYSGSDDAVNAGIAARDDTVEKK